MNPDTQQPVSPRRATDPGPTSAPNPTLVGPLLERVREVAHAIEDRVRAALGPDPHLRVVRALVVDDHPDSADSLAALLDLLGCRARACYDGPGALEVAREFQPHACLLDLAMPGMDGLELAARLRAEAGPRPLLLVATTAFGDQEAQARTALAGFHYHLVKPVEPASLVEALARFGARLGRRPPHPRPDES